MRMAEGWLQTATFPEYMHKLEDALNEDTSDEEHCLWAQNRNYVGKFKAKVQYLLLNPLSKLLEMPTSILDLFENQKWEDLQLAFSLFKRHSPLALQKVSTSFRNFIFDIGNGVVDDHISFVKTSKGPAITDTIFMQLLLDLHDLFKTVCNKYFNNNELFRKALKDAFQDLVNRDMGKESFAEHLATYCQRVLRIPINGAEAVADEEVESTLEKCMEMFCFLNDKDLFSEIYRKQLANRIQTNSANLDFEKSMIAKLKKKCGEQYTKKLEGIINDIKLASDLIAEWERDYLNRGMFTVFEDNVPFEFYGMVLTSEYWPAFPSTDALLTPEMQRCIGLFEKFYKKNTQHRRLQWIYSLGVVRMTGKFNGQKYDLIVNTYHCLILMLFNADADLDVVKIHNSIGLQDIRMTKKLLHLLWGGENKLLLRAHNFLQGEMTDGIADKDVFRVNKEFQSQHRKIKIPQPGDEETYNKEKIEVDRSAAIEAVIVRIMKKRKTLAQSTLTSEVLSELNHFQPDPKIIKQRIENLFEREFLQRDGNDSNTVHYLA